MLNEKDSSLTKQDLNYQMGFYNGGFGHKIFKPGEILGARPAASEHSNIKNSLSTVESKSTTDHC